jgi:hypothetical protein
MNRYQRLAGIAALATSAVPAMAQTVGNDPLCSAAMDNVGYPPLTRFVPAEAAVPARGALRGVVIRAITWRPGETLTVCFRAGTPKARARIAEFASEWMSYANITFDFGDKNNPRTCKGDNSEHIKIDFVDKGPASGYWSHLGTNSRKFTHSMNLSGMGADALPIPVEEAKRITQHEFGHALGLLHEHQSPKGNCDAEYYEEAVFSYGALLGWSRETAITNFKQYANSTELNASDIDRQSIMHYSLPPWLFKAGPQSPCFVKPNYAISQGDRDFMARVYPKLEAVATRGVAQRTAAQRRTALMEEYKAELTKAGVEKARVERLVKEFGETLPTK